MPVSALARVLVMASAVVAVVAPGDLTIAVPPAGWARVTVGPAASTGQLDFDAYAARQPASVEHIDPASETASAITATVDVWRRRDEILVTEIVHSPDAETAISFVDQAAANAIATGLAAADSIPFAGAWAYGGETPDGWSQIVSWSQGRYSVTMTLLSVDESSTEELAQLADGQAAVITDRTGEPPGDEPLPADTGLVDRERSGPIWLVVLGVLAVIGAAWYAFGRARGAATRSRERSEVGDGGPPRPDHPPSGPEDRAAQPGRRG